MSKRKLTSHQRELRSQYNKERKRIQQFVRRRTKQGFIMPENIVPPSVSQLLKSGKTVTSKEIKKISNITPEYIYVHSQFLDVTTGEVIEASVGKVLARKRQYIDGEIKETYVEPPSYSILQRMKDKFMSLEHTNPNDVRNGRPFDDKYRNTLAWYLDEMYNEYGEDYLDHLLFNEGTINELCSSLEVSYDTRAFQGMFAQLVKALTPNYQLSDYYASTVVEMIDAYMAEGDFYE